MDRGFVADCVGWDVVNWSKALSFWNANIDLSNKELLCLELGSGKGGLSLWLASKGNHVVCSDIQDPKSIAEPIHKKYSLKGKIAYEVIDARSIPYKNHFDVIIFKSILGGISRDGDYQKAEIIEQIYQSLKNNGILLFAENLTGSKIHQFFRRHLRPWGSYWNYLSLDELEPLLCKFKRVQYESAGVAGAFGANEFLRNCLGRLDTLILERIVSDKRKYLVYGLATKIQG